MSDTNPTETGGNGGEGVSTIDRLERFLAAEDAPATEETPETQQANQPEHADEPVEAGEDAPQGDDEPQITTSDLAKYLGLEDSMLDVDDAGQVSVKTKIDGKEGTAKLADVLKSYQLQGHIDNKSRALAEQQQAMNAHMAQVEQAAQARLQQVEDMFSLAQNELMREFNAVDWQTLRVTDPAEYSARHHDFQARNNQLQGMLQNVQQQRAQQSQQSMQMNLQQQHEALVKAIPEWTDEAKATTGKAEVAKYLKQNGFGPEEIGRISDHRAVIMTRKAMLYDAMMQQKPTLENKVRSTPKIVKPGTTQQANQRDQSVRNIKQTIRTSGGRQGVAEYLLATGKV